MVTKDDISLAVEYIFQECVDEKMRYPRGDRHGLHFAEKYGCLRGNMEMLKKNPKEFVAMAKKKMARVI
jgi:hypothetical protein